MNRTHRLFPSLMALILLLSMTACGHAAPAAETPLPPETAASTPTPPPAAETSDPAKAPVLSPGAAGDSALSGLIQTGADGTIYTALARGDGLTFLPDLLPEVPGIIAGFLRGPDGFYVSVKDAPFSLEPAALYFYPDGGEGRLVTADLHPGGLFCLSGGTLFFETFSDIGLWRLGAGESQPRRAVDGDAWLLGADSGFIYYSKDGGVCRNDSTMTAEVRLFDDGGVARLLAGSDGLCSLTYAGNGDVVLEFRAPDGTLRTTRTPGPGGDDALLHDGRVYVPGDGSVLVYALADGSELPTLLLPEGENYIALRGAAGDRLYYEAFDGEAFHIRRMPLDGGEPQDLGISENQ